MKYVFCELLKHTQHQILCLVLGCNSIGIRFHAAQTSVHSVATLVMLEGYLSSFLSLKVGAIFSGWHDSRDPTSLPLLAANHTFVK